MTTLNIRNFVRQLTILASLVLFVSFGVQAQQLFKPVPIQKFKFKPIPVVKEDCVSFNPRTAAVKHYKGSQYRILDGNHAIFLFPNYKEAVKALKIIKRYKINSSCYVGRPGPSFKYLLVNGKSPQGAVSGEDCIGFNPAKIKVVCIKGRWKIVEGSHWIFDFNKNEKEARQAYAIIKKHGFTKSCYVGRPGPSLTYLRK